MRMSVATVPTLPRASRTIGAILMDAGLLSAEDAEQILRLQRQNLRCSLSAQVLLLSLEMLNSHPQNVS